MTTRVLRAYTARSASVPSTHRASRSTAAPPASIPIAATPQVTVPIAALTRPRSCLAVTVCRSETTETE